MALDLNELSLEDIATQPLTVKLAIIAVGCLLMIGAALWFDSKAQLKQLEQERQNEQTLREEFEQKQQQAASLIIYQQQLKAIKRSLGKLINQLPASTEVPALLEDISKTGVAAGLVFQLFEPLREEQREFIAELPIKISVTGDYHQLAKFVSNVVGLSRIVTLHDFSIVPEEEANKQIDPQLDENHKLVMVVTAKTYRYRT